MQSSIRTLCLAIFLAAGLASVCPTALAQPAPAASSAPSKANAALRYWVIFAQITKDQGDKLRDIDFDKLTTAAEVKAAYEGAGFKYPDLGIVDNLVEASRLPHCDFEVDMTLGPYVLMPHLAQIRTCSRLLRIDARRLAFDGHRDEAAQRIAAILRMASHTAGDKVMISSLVGVAVAEVGFTEGTKLLESGKLSPAAAHELEQALLAMDVRDPMQLRSAVVSEGRFFPDWVERESTQPGGMDRIQALRLDSSAGEDGAKIDRLPLTSEQFRTDLPRLRQAYASLDTVWTAADPVAAAGEIEKKCIAGEYGILAKEWLPSMSRAYKSAQRFISERSEFLKKVQAAS